MFYLNIMSWSTQQDNNISVNKFKNSKMFVKHAVKAMPFSWGANGQLHLNYIHHMLLKSIFYCFVVNAIGSQCNGFL